MKSCFKIIRYFYERDVINDFYFRNIYEIKIEDFDDVFIKYIKNFFEKKVEIRFR